MNIEHLRLFTRLATTQNISAAGKEFGLSPAVASNHLNKLEQDLAARLFHRTTRKVVLTEEGQALLPYAIDILEKLTLAEAAIGGENQQPKGTLKVSAPASFGRMHLLPAIKSFLQTYPQLTIDFRLSDTLIDPVAGGFDVTIRNAQLDDSSLIARKLAADRRIITASPDYLARHGTPTTPADLLQHQCINLSGYDHWSFATEQGKQTVTTSGPLHTDNGDVIREACSAGIGIAINSKWSAYKQLQSGELVEVLADYPLMSDTAIWAMYSSNKLLAPKIRVFIDYLLEYFGPEPYWEQ